MEAPSRRAVLKAAVAVPAVIAVDVACGPLGRFRNKVRVRMRARGGRRAAKLRRQLPLYENQFKLRDAYPADHVVFTPGFKPGPYWFPLGRLPDGDIGWALRLHGGASGP